MIHKSTIMILNDSFMMHSFIIHKSTIQIINLDGVLWSGSLHSKTSSDLGVPDRGIVH